MEDGVDSTAAERTTQLAWTCSKARRGWPGHAVRQCAADLDAVERDRSWLGSLPWPGRAARRGEVRPPWLGRLGWPSMPRWSAVTCAAARRRYLAFSPMAVPLLARRISHGRVARGYISHGRASPGRLQLAWPPRGCEIGVKRDERRGRWEGNDSWVRDWSQAGLARGSHLFDRRNTSLFYNRYRLMGLQGCDGSVLLDPTPANPETEKTAPINIGLAAFEVIDEIKAAVEARCPGTVSCADIVVYAARDAASILSNGHVHFAAPAGRLDGTVSRAADAQRDLPDSTFTVQELIHNFARKNFTVEELVILSGAHAVGVGHCSSLRARLTAPPDQIVPAYRGLLNAKCGAGKDPVVPNNVRDEDPAAVAAAFPSFLHKLRKAKDFLDNSYYHNNLARIVTFNSDWQLLTEKEALGHVKEYAENGTLWDEDFADSLLKLSKLPLPKGSKGEIRNKCRWVNHHHY